MIYLLNRLPNMFILTNPTLVELLRKNVAIP